jgi:WD40 repeat protein
MSSSPPRMNPFPGLRPFTQDEDYLFFGREEQTLELLQRLGSHRFVAVVGTSGSGKSSLVRCGLLSELQGGKMLGAGAAWEIAVTHPGGNPLALLTEALLDADIYDREAENTRENLLATLSRSHFGLVEAIKQAGLGEETNFLLVVDQFEEIFRFREAGQTQQEAANEFVSILLEAAAQKKTPIYVVLTMRSDFIGECGQFEGLAEMVNQGEFLIPRLTRDQYKRVIEGPIKVAGGQIAPRLLQRLLNDLGQQADQLPCLQHALMRTWNLWTEKADHEALDLDDYQRVGRMSEALSLHADEVFDSLASDRQRQLCAGVFKALTVQESENRGIRRPQRLGRLCQILDVPADELLPIIDAYRHQGVTFLMPSQDIELTDRTIIDISHESLMRVWTRLRHWVEEEAQAARIYLRLSESAALYHQGKAGLYRDPELGIALAWQESQRPNAAWAERYHPNFDPAMAFLAASQEASIAEERGREAARQRELDQARQLAEAQQLRLEQQQRAARKLRRMIAGLAAVAVFAGVACVLALIANQRANTLAEIAQQNATRAEQSQKETANALAIVESQKADVEGSLSKAEAAERVARIAEEKGRKLLYTTDMQLAPFVWRDDRATAQQLRVLLAKHIPDGKADSKLDLRGFEWHYYKHLLERSAAVFSGHAVAASAFASNGQLVTLDHNGQLRHWNLDSQDEDLARRHDLPGGADAQVRALSPSGRLAALAVGGKVHVFDTATGQEKFQIPSANVGSRRLIFSRDEESLVIVDNMIRWVSAVDGERIANFSRYINRVGGVALSADGQTLAVVGHSALGKEYTIFRLDAATRKITQGPNLLGIGGTISAAALSPDGQWIALGYSFDAAVSVSETATGRVIARHSSAHASSVRALACSDDGAKLATADAEGTVKIWANAQKLNSKSAALLTLKGHQGGITSAQFSRDGKRLVTASADKTARVWDLDNAGAAIRPLERVGNRCDTARFSPDGLLIAAADGTAVRLWDAATGRLVRQLSAGDKSTINSVAFSPTDSRLLAVGHGGLADVSYVALWDIDTGTQLARLPGSTDLPDFQTNENSGVIGALAFSPDGKYLVAGFGTKFLFTKVASPNPLKVWEVATRRLIRRLHGHTGFCISLDFSKDGTLLASGSRDGTAIIWSTTTWKETKRLQNVEPNPPPGQVVDHVEDVAFSPNAKTLAMASRDGTVRLLNVDTGDLLESLKGHSSAVTAVAYSPDGRTLASGSADQTVRLWNVETWRELMQLDPGSVELGTVRTLAFAPDGKHLLAGGLRANIWSANSAVWNDADRAAEKLRLLLRSNAEFQSRIRILSENLRLHEALAKLDSKDVRVQAALAATRANWHASQKRWAEAAKEFDRLVEIRPSESAPWLRTPGLLRVATALLHQNRPADAALLLQGGAKRRSQDGLPAITKANGLGFKWVLDEVRITELLPSTPAARSQLRPGDIVLKINGVAMTKETIPNAAKMLAGKVGTTVRLTVRHPGSMQTEDIDLVKEMYRVDDATGELFLPMLAAVERRLSVAPEDAGLLELRAELAGQESDFAWQVADYTEAIEILSEQPAKKFSARLQRLYRRRGDAFFSLQKWPEAVEDYDHVITQDTTDVTLLSQRARAHEALKKWDAAAADWERAAIGHPQGAKWHGEFARRLAAGGHLGLAKDQFAKSQTLYERAFEGNIGSDQMAAELAQLLLDKLKIENAARWTVLTPSQMKAAGGATLAKLQDNSILAAGKNPLQDSYTLTFGDLPARIQALCLEVLPHESLPQKGPGRHSSGNFHLTTIKAELELSTSSETPRTLKLAKAAADFSQAGFSVAGAVDANDDTSWGIFPMVGKPHLAVLKFAEPAQAVDGTVLRLTLEFKSYSQAPLGRFRLLASGDAEIFDREQQRFAAMQLTDPWARLAAAYRLTGNHKALDTLLKQRPEAAVGVGDLYAAVQDWERAIAEYRKAITDQPLDGNLWAKLAAVHESAGRTREAIPYLAAQSAANPNDTILFMKVAGLQAWFGQDKELGATRQQVLAYAKGTNNAPTADRAVKACSMRPSTDKAESEAVMALAREAVKLGKDHAWLPYYQLSLGMAEYRSGNFAAADAALLAAATAGKDNPRIAGPSAFYRAMSLFRQGKEDEARQLAIAAAAKMKPLPNDENNPLAANNTDHDDLILWLAYKEAKAMIRFDEAPPPKLKDGKQ